MGNMAYDVPLIGTAKDYSQQENWMLLEKNPDKKVDVFYLYPTSVSPKNVSRIGEVDGFMRHAAKLSYLKSADAFSSYTNVYAPYYRQVSLMGIIKARTSDGLMRACQNNVVRTDVFAALDYYFEHLNQGRPYILAGHSQGSCNLKLVLSQYMTVHPEYYERMVACYAIGFTFPEAWFAANPHVKKAAGETDTGVLISWNTEGANCTDKKGLLGGGDTYVINPLSWRTDADPIGIERNLGSAEVDEKLNKRIVPGKADATIDPDRCSLVCTTDDNYISALIFGKKSFHLEDWALYYENIKENGRKRIEAYFKDRD